MNKVDIKKYDALVSHLYAHYGKDEDIDRLIEVITDETRELINYIEPLMYGKNICPKCNSELYPRYYQGYYDGFPYWECKCSDKDEFFTKDTYRGGYA